MDSIGNTSPSQIKHPTPLMLLHWGTLLAIVVAVAMVLLREVIDEKAVRKTLLGIHQNAGLFVLLFVFGRIIVRMRYRQLVTAIQLPPLLRLAASATHLALYGLLLALPILGILLANSHGRPVNFLGLFDLPLLIGKNADLGDSLELWHFRAAVTLGAVVAMHAAAALWHHFVRRDGVLLAMLPATSQNRA